MRTDTNRGEQDGGCGQYKQARHPRSCAAALHQVLAGPATRRDRASAISESTRDSPPSIIPEFSRANGTAADDAGAAGMEEANGSFAASVAAGAPTTLICGAGRGSLWLTQATTSCSP